MRRLSPTEILVAGSALFAAGMLYEAGGKFFDFLTTFSFANVTITDIASMVIAIMGVLVMVYGLHLLRSPRIVISASPVAQQAEPKPVTVSIGGRTFDSSRLYKRADLPGTDEVLANAKSSAYFSGDSLHNLVDSYAPTLANFAGKIKMGFLLVDPDSNMSKAIVADSDQVKNIGGKTERSLSTLIKIRSKTLSDERHDEFDIRLHRGLPFSMLLVDTEDKNSSSSYILVGYYSYGTPAFHRPCALISPGSETYDVLLLNFRTAWENARRC